MKGDLQQRRTAILDIRALRLRMEDPAQVPSLLEEVHTMPLALKRIVVSDLRFPPDLPMDRGGGERGMRLTTELEDWGLFRSSLWWLAGDALQATCKLLTELMTEGGGDKSFAFKELKRTLKVTRDPDFIQVEALQVPLAQVGGLDLEALRQQALQERFDKEVQNGLATVPGLVDRAVSKDFRLKLSGDSLWMLSHALVAEYQEAKRGTSDGSLIFDVLDRAEQFVCSDNIRQRLLRDLVGISVNLARQDKVAQAMALVPTPEEVEVDGLAFNMACMYVKQGDTKAMLPWIDRSLDLGKSRNEFLNDADFSSVVEDPDFLAVIERGR